MNTPAEVRADIELRLAQIVESVNRALEGGARLLPLEECLKRLGRGRVLPHWFVDLRDNGSLPNLDGKSLGSVIEMIFVATLEKNFYPTSRLVPFKINPARGIDVPSIGLGIKSPSENYCTSEPFFSAYERLIGNEHDAVILLTDYQTAKSTPPLKIRIIKQAYLRGSQLADRNLCIAAKRFRDEIFPDEAQLTELKKIARFLAYINQSDIEAKVILRLLSAGLSDSEIDSGIAREIAKLEAGARNSDDVEKVNLIPQLKDRLRNIQTITPRIRGLTNAADGWVIETQKDFGRYANDSEWARFTRGPLDGRIGMSYALQWRFNFGSVFGGRAEALNALAEL